MHFLQPKHSKLNEKEEKELLESLNISKSQLPQISEGDAGLPEGCEKGDIIKIERNQRNKKSIYYRVVV